MKEDFIKDFIPPKIENAHGVLVKLLKDKGLKISVAESFTGGNICAKITSVSGASSVFYEGIIAYNEKAKIGRLSVDESTLKKCYPVSKEVASQMANGLISSGNCDLAISTTGIAGPNSDESGFPVGLCFIGVSFKGKTTVYEYNLNGNRQENVSCGVQLALNIAINTLKNI